MICIWLHKKYQHMLLRNDQKIITYCKITNLYYFCFHVSVTGCKINNDIINITYNFIPFYE